MIHVREFTSNDLAFGMQLKGAAGWNQTEADWKRAFELEPQGCFVAEYEGRPAGTTTTCVFGDVAWIAMVLVDESLRGKGIGKALMTHAIEYLDGRGVRSIRLDATALGRPLYEKLGFSWEFTLERHVGTLPEATTSSLHSPRLCSPADFVAVCNLDREVTQTDREKLLASLLKQRPADARVIERSGQLVGFSMTRAGSRATQIGPCIASQAEVGGVLILDAFVRHANLPIYIDIPLDNESAAALAKVHGLTVQRDLLRMGRGPRVPENARAIWASFGPEKG